MLAQQLTNQQDQLTQMITLLEKERLLLKARNIIELEVLIQKKQELLQKIADLDKEISQNTNQHDLLKEGASLFIQKQKLEDLLKQCKQNNEINGKAITLSLESNTRFSNLLNSVLNRNNLTYDQKGNTQISNTLGKGFTA